MTKEPKTDILIMKFGGSCFKDSAAFNQIIEITELHKDAKKIYVCSALNGITDKLVALTHMAEKGDSEGELALIKEIEERHTKTIEEIFKGFPRAEEFKQKALKYVHEQIATISSILLEIREFGLEPYFSDYVLSYGEKLSTYLLYLYLQMRGYESKYFTGEDLIITNDNFTNALPDYKYTIKRINDAIKPEIENRGDKTIFCITGFIGRNKIGYTTTLGRGGSDFTATIIARCLHEVCDNDRVSIKVILWKDVNGILTADPKYVKKPKLVRKLSYKEAAESAFFGAKILHPKCLAAIERQKIPVLIKNFDNPTEESNFSIISEETEPGDLKGISTIANMAMITVSSGTLVNVPGVLGKIFSVLGDNEISVSLVAQSSSEVNTTFVVEEKDGDKAVEVLRNHPDLQEWFEITKRKVGIIAVIGDEIHKSGAKIFNALRKKDIDVIAIAQSSDDLNISIVVDSDSVKDAVEAIDSEFNS